MCKISQMFYLIVNMNYNIAYRISKLVYCICYVLNKISHIGYEISYLQYKIPFYHMMLLLFSGSCQVIKIV